MRPVCKSSWARTLLPASAEVLLHTPRFCKPWQGTWRQGQPVTRQAVHACRVLTTPLVCSVQSNEGMAPTAMQVVMHSLAVQGADVRALADALGGWPAVRNISLWGCNVGDEVSAMLMVATRQLLQHSAAIGARPSGLGRPMRRRQWVMRSRRPLGRWTTHPPPPCHTHRGCWPWQASCKHQPGVGGVGASPCC